MTLARSRKKPHFCGLFFHHIFNNLFNMASNHTSPTEPLATIVHRIQENFAKQSIMATLGAELGSITGGEVEIILPFAPHILQQNGYAHAGVMTTILDSACGYAALSLLPPEADVLAVEFKINLLAPAIGERFIARGRVLKSGRTLSICTGEAVAVRHGQEKMVAVMQSTVFNSYPK
jgi:uncharacterized protein (TIGR00369 family)